jgi:hypothetical protein
VKATYRDVSSKLERPARKSLFRQGQPKILGLTVSESTQDPTTTSLDLVSGSDSSSGSNPGSFRNEPSSFSIGPRNTTSTLQEIYSNLLQVSSKKLSRLPTGLNNAARAYQDLLQKSSQSSSEATSYRSTGRSCINHNISILSSPLAEYFFPEQQHLTS